MASYHTRSGHGAAEVQRRLTRVFNTGRYHVPRIAVPGTRNTGTNKPYLPAWQPETTEQQVKDYFDQINDLLMVRYEQLEAQLVDKWKAKEGRYPDALTLLQIRRMAQQLAEDQTRGETLDQITAAIMEAEIDDEEDDLFLQAVKDPNGWRTMTTNFQPEVEADEFLEQFWADKSPRFQNLASALLQTMRYHGKEWPWDKNSEEFRILEAKIELAKQQDYESTPGLQAWDEEQQAMLQKFQ